MTTALTPPYRPITRRLSSDRNCISNTFERCCRPSSGGSRSASKRENFLGLSRRDCRHQDYRTMVAIRSGETTRPGRSPLCSDPSTGSKRTRTTSPRRSGLSGFTPDLFRSAVPLLIDLLVPIPHLLAPLNQFAAEFVAFALIQPLLDQLCDLTAPFPWSQVFFESLQKSGWQQERLHVFQRLSSFFPITCRQRFQTQANPRAIPQTGG